MIPNVFLLHYAENRIKSHLFKRRLNDLPQGQNGMDTHPINYGAWGGFALCTWVGQKLCFTNFFLYDRQIQLTRRGAERSGHCCTRVRCGDRWGSGSWKAPFCIQHLPKLGAWYPAVAGATTRLSLRNHSRSNLPVELTQTSLWQSRVRAFSD